MKEISFGGLTFVGELAGAHVHVTVLGAGVPGQRPLCGRITVRLEEWQAVEATAGAVLLAVKPQAVNNAELARVDLELAKARRAYDELGEDLERAVGDDGTSLERLRTLVAERDKARAELAGLRVLFGEQGKALAASRASVTNLRHRLDEYMPIDSVIGDWDWVGIVEDGVWRAEYERAIEAAGNALAHVAKVQAPQAATEGGGERCGDASVWKGCARSKGHDGGHSTYDIDANAIAKEKARG